MYFSVNNNNLQDFLPVLTYDIKPQRKPNRPKYTRGTGLQPRLRPRRLVPDFSVKEVDVSKIIETLVNNDASSKDELGQKCKGMDHAHFYILAEERSLAGRCGNPLCNKRQPTGIFCSGQCAYKLSGYARSICHKSDAPQLKEFSSQQIKSNRSNFLKKQFFSQPHVQERLCSSSENESIRAQLLAQDALEGYCPRIDPYNRKRHRSELTSAERSDQYGKYKLETSAVRDVFKFEGDLIIAQRSDLSCSSSLIKLQFKYPSQLQTTSNDNASIDDQIRNRVGEDRDDLIEACRSDENGKYKLERNLGNGMLKFEGNLARAERSDRSCPAIEKTDNLMHGQSQPLVKIFQEEKQELVSSSDSTSDTMSDEQQVFDIMHGENLRPLSPFALQKQKSNIEQSEHCDDLMRRLSPHVLDNQTQNEEGNDELNRPLSPFALECLRHNTPQDGSQDELINAERSDTRSVDFSQNIDTNKANKLNDDVVNPYLLPCLMENEMTQAQNCETSELLIKADRSDEEGRYKLELDGKSDLLKYEGDLVTASRSSPLRINQESTANFQEIVVNEVLYQTSSQLTGAERSDLQGKYKLQMDPVQNNFKFGGDLISAERSDGKCQNLFIETKDAFSSQLNSQTNIQDTKHDLVNAQRSDEPGKYKLEADNRLGANRFKFEGDLVAADRSDCKPLDLFQEMNSAFTQRFGSQPTSQQTSEELIPSQRSDEPGKYKLEQDGKFATTKLKFEGDLINAERSTGKCYNLFNDMEAAFLKRFGNQASSYTASEELVCATRSDEPGKYKLESDPKTQQIKLEGDLLVAQRSGVASPKLQQTDSSRQFTNTKIGEKQQKQEVIQKLAIAERSDEPGRCKLETSCDRDTLKYDGDLINASRTDTVCPIFAKLDQQEINQKENTTQQSRRISLTMDGDTRDNLYLARSLSLPPLHTYKKAPRSKQQGILKKTYSGNFSGKTEGDRKVKFGMPTTFHLPPSVEENTPIKTTVKRVPSKILDDDNVRKFDDFLQKQRRKTTTIVSSEERNLQDELLKAFKIDNSEEEEICSSLAPAPPSSTTSGNSLFADLKNSLRIKEDDDQMSSDDEDLDEFKSKEQRQKQETDSDSDSDSDGDEFELPKLTLNEAKLQVEISDFDKIQAFLVDSLTNSSRQWICGVKKEAVSVQCDATELAIRNSFLLMMCGRLTNSLKELRVSKIDREDLEQNLMDLVRTMRFSKELPGLGMLLWNLVLVVLLHALSTHRQVSLQSIFSEDKCKLQILQDYASKYAKGMDVNQLLQLKEEFVLHQGQAY